MAVSPVNDMLTPVPHRPTELMAYWRIIRKRWWLILLLAILATGAAAYYVRQQVPLYRTTTTLFINPAAPSELLPYQTTRSVESLANTYAEYMRTRSFASLVAERLPYQLDVGTILNALSVNYVRDTQIFRISATHPNPEVAQALANTAAQVLIAENTARQRSEQAQIREQLDPNAQAERERLQAMQQVLQDELDYYDERIQVLEAQIQALERGPQDQDTLTRILDLRRELLDLRANRVSVLSSLADAQVALAQVTNQSPAKPVDTAVVVDEAPLPTTPLPRPTFQLVLAALVGAVGLGIALAFGLEYLDYTVRSPEELDAVYGLPTQGAIGAATLKGTQKDVPPLVTLHAPRSPIAEAFRSLRTSLRLAGLGDEIRSLLVTSAGPGEGKTFVAANLAVSLAMEGRRVLLVDLDLRKPRVHTVFDVPRSPGFTELLLDRQAEPQAYFRATAVEGLWLLTCGELPGQPAELLASARTGQILAHLAEQVDVVVFDSPPAATVTDAILIARHADAALQVVRAGKTRQDLIRRCRDLLARTEVRILGPVLNDVRGEDLGYYSNYYYYSGYYQNTAAEHGNGRKPHTRRRQKETVRSRP